MAIGVTDISEITDKLLGVIRTALNASLPGQTDVSGSMPETVRDSGGCQVSLYLYHVAHDRNLRNSPAIGSQVQRQRPFGLELFYLLSAFSAKDYIKEQQAMTVAMRALFDHPYLRLGPGREELTVNMESESIDKLGILWQAVSAPFRLTAMYKVSIAFLTPPDPAPLPAPKPASFALVADPSGLPFGDLPLVIGTANRVLFDRADGVRSSYDVSPASAAPGQLLSLFGSGMNQPGSSDQVFLLDTDGTNERDITAWRVPDATLQTPTRHLLRVPAPPAAPPPGAYVLKAGGGAARTNPTPVSIAPLVTVGVNPPILAPAAGLFTVSGSGFIAGRTEVLLETVRVADLQVQTGASLTFRAPAGLAAGTYAVRIRVNDVEAPPSWWVVIP